MTDEDDDVQQCWGGRELTLLCGFHQYTLLQNRDNSGLLGTLVYCSLKLGGLKLGGGGRRPPCPPYGPPLNTLGITPHSTGLPTN